MADKMMIPVGGVYETLRTVPAVTQKVAEALGRPAQKHVVRETWQDEWVFDGRTRSILSKRLTQERIL